MKKCKGSGLLMTTLYTCVYKENGISRALNVSMLTNLLLDPSKTVIPGPIFMI